MARYAIACLARKQVEGEVSGLYKTVFGVCSAQAGSQIEAEILGLALAQKCFPESDGWEDHEIAASRAEPGDELTLEAASPLYPTN